MVTVRADPSKHGLFRSGSVVSGRVEVLLPALLPGNCYSVCYSLEGSWDQTILLGSLVHEAITEGRVLAG